VNFGRGACPIQEFAVVASSPNRAHHAKYVQHIVDLIGD
jgi:hypothetical protein